MFRVGICDDDMRAACLLEAMVIEILTEMKLKFDTEVFTSGKELFSWLDGGHFCNLLFMDIEMGEMDGIQAGWMLRTEKMDYDTILIYVSRHDHLHPQLYINKPSFFIRKPVLVGAVRKALTLVMQEIKLRAQNFTYLLGDEIITVRRRDIFYFEGQIKDVRIVTIERDDLFRGTLRSVRNQLSGDEDFLLVHRSYIGNLQNVKRYLEGKLHFENGQSVPVAIKRRADVRKALEKYFDGWGSWDHAGHEEGSNADGI